MSPKPCKQFKPASLRILPPARVLHNGILTYLSYAIIIRKKKITEVNRANLQTDSTVITVVEKHFYSLLFGAPFRSLIKA
jgi:hypothetical protein